MKKILVILALVLPMMASAQKYGHVNTAELFQLMPELKDVTARLDSLNKQYESLLVNMQEEYQKKAQEYEQKASTMTDAMKQIQEEELYTMQQRLQTTYQTAQQDIAQKRQEFVAPIQEKMLKAIQAVGQEKGFTYIFDTAAMVYVDPTATDVMADVKAKLGIK
ncbi:MAG: OmpH family outer membrane protein [Bacteroidales bacterium]|jgi:outer membrane protein|nr:OmpH family outer membrane protein [Bacteroidales bacterium]MBQ7672728.1 OmpH family outer membrane protein [Paludibacteraceae bacterium]MBR4546451.1 OmpH family outer membrane protein [Paludibacteraceae bacterium]MBR6146184.1 OmpH family outer membrane protein [Paludibacteraceae bacterium]